MINRRKGRNRGLSRRDFLHYAGAASTLPLVAACASSSAPDNKVAQENPFKHGVASGDPLPDRVMFWTRVTASEPRVPVSLSVFRDVALTQLAARGSGMAEAERDWTVKIDLGGLQPGTTYYYRFEALGHHSITGRTRTAPAAGASRLRFGVVSCSSYAHGYFNAYRMLAQRADIDAILHLGDYVYEYGTGEYGDVRGYQPDHEMTTLADYRTRHAYYKQEPDLMELHRQFPFITIWDDHETTDNSWRDGANNHTEGAEGAWPQRKAWGQQAYAEWMPIRYPDSGNVGKIWRKFSYGGLADLFMLDTRLYDRDEPDGMPASATGKEPGRRMLGPEQKDWLLAELSVSSASWKIIGGQVVFHQWNLAGLPRALGGGLQLNGDSWDGYQAERQEIIDHLRAQNIGNVVMLSGDVHSSWCADISDDPVNLAAYNPLTGAGSLAVEFVCTAVTSPFAIPLPEGQQAFMLLNPHIRYTDWDRKGYMVLDVTPERTQGEYWYVNTITAPEAGERFGTAYAVAEGANHLGLLPVAQSTPPEAPELAP